MNDRDIRDALGAVAATAIGTGARPVELTRATETAFLDAVSHERVTGLAVAAVETGTMSATNWFIDQLLDRHEHQLALDVRLEQLLIEAALILDAHDIPYRALKGPVLAHTVYADPALRSFGDVDLLVPGGHFDAAIDRLRAAGFERRFVEPRSNFDARFSKGACVVRGDGMEIDLHRTLAPGAFGMRIGELDFFARAPHTFELGGVAIAGVDRELAFVHACFHAALGDFPPRLVPIRDVAQSFDAGIDAPEVIRLAEVVRCEGVFQRAVALVELELGVRLEGTLPAWARAHRQTLFTRWALRGYATPDRSYSRQIAASWCSLPSLRNRASYTAALAFPNRSYARAREGGYRRRMQHALRVLRDGATG